MNKAQGPYSRGPPEKAGSVCAQLSDVHSTCVWTGSGETRGLGVGAAFREWSAGLQLAKSP